MKGGENMNQYRTLRDKQQKEVNEFPMFFAFSNKQFEEGMAKFGLTPDQTDKIYKFGNTGGFYLRTDSEKLFAMFEKHEKERSEAIASDPTGEGYIYEMFLYELRNHEYGYTGDTEDTLNALGLTMEEIEADERLSHGFKKAKMTIWNEGD